MDSNLHRLLNNHIIIIFNITEFILTIIDVPLYLKFIQVGKVWLHFARVGCCTLLSK
jgi:hypothetical protein